MVRISHRFRVSLILAKKAHNGRIGFKNRFYTLARLPRGAPQFFDCQVVKLILPPRRLHCVAAVFRRDMRASEHFVVVVALVVRRTAGSEVFAYELSLAAVDLDLPAVGLHDLLLGLPFGQTGQDIRILPLRIPVDRALVEELLRVFDAKENSESSSLCFATDLISSLNCAMTIRSLHTVLSMSFATRSLTPHRRSFVSTILKSPVWNVLIRLSISSDLGS